MAKAIREDVPTTWLDRFREVLGLLCGGQPPEELCRRWQDHVDNDLQDWIGRHALGHMPSWCTAIGTIEAAEAMANTPVDDEIHAPRPAAVQPAI